MMTSDQKTKALLCYLLPLVGPLVIYLTEKKEERFIRFHAMQGILLVGVEFVLSIFFNIIGKIPWIGWIFSLGYGIAVFAVWITCMVRAYRGEFFKLPIIGDRAEEMVN